MNQNVQPHSNAWITFTYVSFSASAFMVALGVYYLPIDFWMKANHSASSAVEEIRTPPMESLWPPRNLVVE